MSYYLPVPKRLKGKKKCRLQAVARFSRKIRLHKP